MQPSILIVIPTYGHFEYAAKAALSALTNTKTLRPLVVLIDDASPEWDQRNYPAPGGTSTIIPGPAEYDGLSRFHGSVFYSRFGENGGLTRSWNRGLADARHLNADYCCVTNSDVVFPERWEENIHYGLNIRGYSLVGPVTNAPGTNADQYVQRYSTLYVPKRGEADVQLVQDELIKAQCLRYKETTLNGFCLVAKTATWWENAYDADHVFRPRNDFNSKGEPNPTPLMTLNEYELQRRWHDKGLKSAACLGSYVYHYRAVSRGDKHKRGDWARIKGTA